ncbi:MAG: cytochrome P450 [Myxococcota bacterium]
MSAHSSSPSLLPVPAARFWTPDLVRFLWDPRATLQRYVHTAGDPFGVPGTVFTGDPACLRALFAADPDGFDIPLREQLTPFFGGASLILTGGARHRRDRRLLMPPFHGARLVTYGEVIRDAARKAAAEWRPGVPFRMHDAMKGVTLEVILRAVFGVEAPERRERFREAVHALAGAMASPAIAMFQSLRRPFGGYGPWARFLRARDRFDALVHEEIAARQAERPDRHDILSLMIAARYEDGSAMTTDELRDQLHLLLFAGHDTTSTALTWAFYWLDRHPEVRAEVVRELDALGPDPEPTALAALPYLEAVCKETLRIHPVVMHVGRLVREPFALGPYEVPAGTTVMASALILHEREDLYPEPRRFRPERFLERSFGPSEYIPFGGGSRRCLGAALAMFEMKVVLGTLARAHPVRAVDPRPVKCVLQGLTMGPKGGIPMVT